jgi:hypothetical protein
MCTNRVTIPEPSDRNKIILENHASAIGGHAGITKNYKRMRLNYFWSGMKTVIQNFIQECTKYAKLPIKKVGLCKISTIHDPHGHTAFDKVSMDIVGPLPTIDSGYRYILTIQDLLIKYSVAVPLKQAIRNSRDAGRKVYQSVYRAESLDNKSEIEFYKQRDASYSS